MSTSARRISAPFQRFHLSRDADIPGDFSALRLIDSTDNWFVLNQQLRTGPCANRVTILVATNAKLRTRAEEALAGMIADALAKGDPAVRESD